MTDDQALSLLDLLAVYFEDHGPAAGGEPPSNLLCSELAGDLRGSLPRGREPNAARLDRLGLI